MTCADGAEGPSNASNGSMGGFKGTVPVVACRLLSGLDCSEQVTPDDAYCRAGHPVPTRELPVSPYGFSTDVGPRRPQYAIREQVNFVTMADEPTVAAKLAARPNDLVVSRRACDQCATHHGIDEDAARAELRLLVGTGATLGKCQQTATGYWRVDYKNFVAVLDPSARVIVSYATRHYERTPSEVFRRTPSRFGKRMGIRPGKAIGIRTFGPPLELDELRRALTEGPTISERLAGAWAHRSGCEPGPAAADLAERASDAGARGLWERAPDGSWVVTWGDQVWLIAPDGPLVLATWPAASGDRGRQSQVPEH